ncbi:MAG: molybdopterin-binding protein, partial [Planctomycetota bacterium]|nr:molybdopterin-binding protein [Planctomycetota bacterium]
MRAVVLSIGTELVCGLRLDTHAADIARAVAGLGVDVVRHETLDDDTGAIASALRRAADAADVVITTGGLGPTRDDCTRHGLAEATGAPLAEHPDAVAHLAAWAQARGREVGPSNRVQTLLPEGAEPLPNPVGTAVGIAARLGEARIFCLPGVPAEMRPMLEGAVLPRLREAQPGRATRVRTIRTFGLPESEVGERLADLMAAGRHPRLGTACHAGVIDVHVYASGPPEEVDRLLEADAAEVRRRLGSAVFGEGEKTMEAAVADLLRDAGATVALAESCTGGLVAAKLVNVPGM